MRHGTLAIVIGGLVCTIIAGVQLGPLAASGMALGAALILAFRSNAAKAGLRALRYARLEKQIKHGLERYGLPSPDPDHDPDAVDGFRVAGLSFDQDASATRKRAEFENWADGLSPRRGPDGSTPRPRVESLPLAVRLRDEAGPRLPQMMAQNRARLDNEAADRFKPQDKGD